MKLFLLLLFTCLIVLNLFSQNVGINTSNPIHPFQVNVDSSGTVEVMDQNQTSHNGSFNIGLNNGAGQSVVIGQSGQLSKITVRLNTQTAGSPGMVELKVHQGNNPNAPIIATLPISVTSNSQSNYTVDLPLPYISFQVNDPIFISIAYVSGNNVQWRKSNMNPYAAGIAAVFSGTWTYQNLDDVVFAIQMIVPNTTSVNALSVTQTKQLGVGVIQPIEKLEVNGAIKISAASSENPEAGTIRWNAVSQDFEGFNGTKWQSLTKAEGGWGPLPNNNANERQKIISPDAGSDYFGSSVSIYQDYAIVGSPSAPGLVNNSGAAYIFKKNGQNWIQHFKLMANDGAGSDYFGNSVSIYQDYAVVGARLDDDAGAGSGSAYVFIRSGNTWTQQEKLVASDAAAGDNFGQSVSIFGPYIVIGSPLDDDNADASGSVYIFERSGVIWTQQPKLLAADWATGDRFGNSVHIDGNFIVVGAPIKANGIPDIGAAYVFKRNTTNNTWSQDIKFLPTNTSGNTYFGESVSIFDSTVVVGARLHDEFGTDAGLAFVYTKSVIWGSIPQKLIANDIATDDWFGLSVDISSQYILVTSSKFATALGYACVFKKNGPTWIQESKLIGSDSIPGDYFGFYGAVYDDLIIIGAPYDDTTNTDQGAVYFFGK